jgi:hypothetical protein
VGGVQVAVDEVKRAFMAPLTVVVVCDGHFS